MLGHHLFWGKGMARTLSCRLPLLTRGNLVAHVTNDLLGVDQKISDWLIKMIFLVKFRAAIKVMGFSTGDAIWGLWFSF